FDGNMLHFNAEWSELQHDWMPVFSSAFVIPGWVDTDGVAHFDPAQLERALAEEEARVAAYLEARRKPPQLPGELTEGVGRPIRRAALSQGVAAARARRTARSEGRGAEGTMGRDGAMDLAARAVRGLAAAAAAAWGGLTPVVQVLVALMALDILT